MILRCFFLIFTFIVSANSFADLPIVPLKENGFPAGDYPSYCQSCSIDGARLTCACPDPQNNIYKRSLDISLCDPIIVTVKKGILRCTDDYSIAEYEEEKPESEEDLSKYLPKPLQDDPLNELPLGDYKSYCKSCEIKEDGELDCECKIDGFFANFLGTGLVSEYWYPATLPLLSCKDVNRVTYMGGMLYCSLDDFLNVSGKGEKNLGTTCTGCRVKGNDLICKTCEKTRCGWSKTDKRNNLHIAKNVVLENARECRKEIRNCNGTLRCGGCWRWDFWDEWESRRPVTPGTRGRNYCNPNSPYPF